MKRVHLWLLASALAIACGLYLRITLPYPNVFTVDGVNFQETDAWYHARLAEAFTHGIPAATLVDPYASFPDPQRVDVGPVLDLLVASAVKLTGLDSHTASAWCPVALWLLLLLAIGLLARQLFDLEHACVAVILAATLPGTYLRVTSLGFHDHHVLEALFFTTTLYLIARQLPLAAGLSLALYLVTFLGGAILVVFLALWRILSPNAPTLWRAYALAILLLLPFRHMLWMEYSIASLASALLLELLFLRLANPVHRWVAIAVAALAALWAANQFGVLHLALHFTTSQGASTVTEMRWLTPQLAWDNFGPVAAFALAGAWQLIPAPNPYHRLPVVASLSFALLGLFQLRLGYYVAVAIALLASVALSDFFNSLKDPRRRALAPPALLLLLLLPNLWSGYKLQVPDYGVRADWREALEWMRWNTPDPLPQFNQFQPFTSNYKFPPQAYGVLAWWDYGYAITTLAHRIPFTNPTQRNASRAASFLLAQSEAEFLAALRANHLQYIALGDDLPMVPVGRTARGKVPSLAKWAGIDVNTLYGRFDYTNSSGKQSPIILYYPAYYRSPAVRLALYGPDEYIPANNICVATIEGKNAKNLECFKSQDAAQAALRAPGTILAGVNPLQSCVRLEPWTSLETVYQSRERVALIQDHSMPSMRIYRVRDNVQSNESRSQVPPPQPQLVSKP